MERQNFNMDERLAAEDAEFSAFEKEGAYIEIDNSANDPNIAADKIADVISRIERGEKPSTKREDSVIW